MELGIILKNDELVVDSLTVAEVFERDHKNVLRDIRNCISEIENIEIDVLKIEPISYIDANDYFYEDSIRDSYGRKRKIYYMNQKGFTLLVMGYTGQRAFSYKVAYIEQFEEMKRQLQGQNREEMTQAQLLAYIKHYLAGSRVIIQPKDEEMYLDYYCVGIYSLLRYYGFKKSIPCSYIRELRPKVMEIGLAGFEEIVNYCAVKNKLKLAYVKATAQDFQASEVDQAQPPLFSILGLLDYREEVAT
ncbi:TPA: Rha family transcriptional regulator [Streptococcus suis]|nr:Rha family transcriptional regulator [Streptococcus suis]HEM6013145.1 Rha family transcriptional regulator [Streptococcus suis]HEM6041666.1 Rha family transcriptional regulator [Streptococcus suis]HEM6219017.1 Rha family transcriptional regulator [Streptococcus suis]